jgi:ADP-ribose pyrophosphatase YjhB (NUDIX family)
MSMSMEMNFCRRCGSKLTQRDFAHVYQCEKGHVIFANASPTVGVLLMNDKAEVLLVERALEPGKGMFDVPGGFCDGAESLEDAISRELEEEVGLAPADYTTPKLLLSMVDPYEYKGEVIPALSVIFTARIKGEVLLTAGDDVASAVFMKLADIDIDAMYFASIRQAIEYLRDNSAFRP